VFYQVFSYSWQAKKVRGGGCERKERKEEKRAPNNEERGCKAEETIEKKEEYRE